MPNKITVEVEALDYTVNERDVAEALKAHFPNMPTRVQEIRPTPVAADGACWWCEQASNPKNRSVTACPFHNTPAAKTNR